MGTKFLAPMLYAAAVKGLCMRDVLHWLDTREDERVTEILQTTGVVAALDAWNSSQTRGERARDSLYATARKSCTSTQTSGSPLGPRATTSTLTTSCPARTPSTCTPPPTSNGYCGHCSRPSPNRSSPPRRRRRRAPLTGCWTRGLGCSWTRP